MLVENERLGQRNKNRGEEVFDITQERKGFFMDLS